MVRLSKNFTLEELTYSKTAEIYRIINAPTADIIKNLGALVQNVLQPLRNKLKKPIVVTSGYRCKLLNARVGGSSTSQHLYGQAVDIIVNGMGTYELYEYIKKSGLKYDQLILEETRNGSWVHISYCTKLNRNQNLIYRNNIYILDKNT